GALADGEELALGRGLLGGVGGAELLDELDHALAGRGGGRALAEEVEQAGVGRVDLERLQGRLVAARRQRRHRANRGRGAGQDGGGRADDGRPYAALENDGRRRGHDGR